MALTVSSPVSLVGFPSAPARFSGGNCASALKFSARSVASRVLIVSAENYENKRISCKRNGKEIENFVLFKLGLGISRQKRMRRRLSINAQDSDSSPSYSYSSSRSTSILEKGENDLVSQGNFGHEAGPSTSYLQSPEPGATANEKLKWTSQWYPLGILMDMQKDRPHARTLLGLPVVLWWDKNSSKWQAHVDMCPHRLAPLSEGRIHENGDLQCSYHGWTFRGDGSCSMIPQAPSEGPAIHNSPRACVKVYPSMEHQGMLWVWPDTNAADDELAANLPPTIPELDDPDFVYDLNSRDMAYSYETLTENLMDPAHVPFAHHKIMGNRSLAKPIQLSVESINAKGFTGKGETSRTIFYAPTLNYLTTTLPPPQKKENRVLKAVKQLVKGGADTKDEARISVAQSKAETPPTSRRVAALFYCVPTEPGRSKVIFAFARNFAKSVNHILPRWYFHLVQLTILDSDLYLLHVQERRLEQLRGGNQNWQKACFVPTASDAHVAAFRRWLNSFAGAGPAWQGGIDPQLPPTPPKEQLMERYKSHVEQCSSCRRALGGFQRLQMALYGLSFALLAGLVLKAVTQQAAMPLTVALPVVILSAACAAAAVRLGKWIYNTYFFSDYVHALIE